MPEKVWFCTQKGLNPWLNPDARNTRTTEEGGHTIWYDEQAQLAAIEDRLKVKIASLEPDLTLPPEIAARVGGGGGGGSGSGGGGGGAAAYGQSRAAGGRGGRAPRGDPAERRGARGGRGGGAGELFGAQTQVGGARRRRRRWWWARGGIALGGGS